MNDLPCWMEDCDFYLDNPKHDTGFCERVRKGLPICIGHKNIQFQVDGEVIENKNFASCLFYHTSGETANED